MRRIEHKALQATLGESPLTKTRYLWLQHPDRMTDEAWEHFTGPKSANLKTARAWAIKTHCDVPLGPQDSRMGQAWLAGMVQLGNPFAPGADQKSGPDDQKAPRRRRHRRGDQRTPSRAEGFNTMIEELKRVARGFRNRDRFRAAIYIHLGGLDLYPNAVMK